MAIIFSEEDLKDIKPPCVLQSFINHNAVLYKVFVVGEAYSVVQRPSIRNFPSGPTGQLSHTDIPVMDDSKYLLNVICFEVLYLISESEGKL